MITDDLRDQPESLLQVPYNPFGVAPFTQLNSRPRCVVNPASGACVEGAERARQIEACDSPSPHRARGRAPSFGELFKRMAASICPRPLQKHTARGTAFRRTRLCSSHHDLAAPHFNRQAEALAITSAKRRRRWPTFRHRRDPPVYDAEAFHCRWRPRRAVAIVEKRAGKWRDRKSRDIAERFEADGALPVGSTPQQFAAFLKSEMLKWGRVIRDAGIRLEQ